MSLCSCEPNKFCSGEREGSSYQKVTEPLEAVVESSWVSPVSTTNIAGIWTTTTIDHSAKNTKKVSTVYSDIAVNLT
jgi:hypothetical protein